jgi:hypothetical protein
MQAAAEPDDAYLLGQDPRSGLKVAISQTNAAQLLLAQLFPITTVIGKKPSCSAADQPSQENRVSFRHSRGQPGHLLIQETGNPPPRSLHARAYWSLNPVLSAL